MDNWAKGGAQVVVRSIIEVHLVAHIESHADRADVRFKTAAGVESANHVILAQSGHRTGERSEGGRRIVQPEVDEATFGRHERLNVMFSDVHPRTENP